MSHIHLSAVLNEPLGTLSALFEVSWRLPYRVLGALLNKYCEHRTTTSATSIWIAMTTAIFAPVLGSNWQLLLARPRKVDADTAVLFPLDIDHISLDLDAAHGFHAYLYTDLHSPATDSYDLSDAGAVWLHAHGGGFYAGEARQYHHTYLRWVLKARSTHGLDLKILAVEYPLSNRKSYPGALDSMLAAYQYVLAQGVKPSQVIIAGDSAGGNLALSTCYEIIRRQLPGPSGIIMLSPWLDLTRETSGNSPNQPYDWLTTFDSEACRKGAIELYMGKSIMSAKDPRVSPLWRDPISDLPKQFLSAGCSEVLFADAQLWATKVQRALGPDAISCHFAKGQVHTFAIGGWLADRGIEADSDQRLLAFVAEQVTREGH